MTDVLVRGTAARWESGDFPGWLEVLVDDAAGYTHHIIDKVPVLTRASLTSASVFPCELWLSASGQRMDGETVIVQLAHGVTTSEGMAELAIATHDVVWL